MTVGENWFGQLVRTGLDGWEKQVKDSWWEQVCTISENKLSQLMRKGFDSW